MQDIKAARDSGQAVLLNVETVEQAEALNEALRKALGKKWAREHCQLFTAKQQHDKDAIRLRAANSGMVTIATAIAGRGTDIVLGGPDKRFRDKIISLGGLWLKNNCNATILYLWISSVRH